MLIGAIVLALILGLLAGGNIWHLGQVRLQRLPLLAGAVVVRFATEAAISNGVEAADTYRLPLFALAYAMLLAGLWANRTQPGMSLAFVGILGNAIAITANGGFMPIWEPSLAAAQIHVDQLHSVFHVPLGPDLTANFLLHAGPLADVIPIPVPFVRNVASIGDLFLSAGLGFFLFATVVRPPQELDEEELEAVRQRLANLTAGPTTRATDFSFGTGAVRTGTQLAAGLAEAAALERPANIGGDGPALATAGAAAGAAATAAFPGTAAPPIGIERPEILERARRHPYVRLALNGSFSALWAGQLISLFGDRIHQVALFFLVLNATNSPIAVAAVAVAATLPNLLFSPIAGTFVDRWDHREVMVVSDLLRASLVLLLPIVAAASPDGSSLVLIYPLVFLITTISIFFRPARVAVLPRIVRDDELLTANSALWVGETMADIIGYPLAGLFVAFLGSALPLAFWIDAATYVASAALIWTIVVPEIQKRAEAASDSGGFFAELKAGWRFLRGESVLLANTLQATVAQFTLGTLIALTAVYARDVVVTVFEPEAVFAFLETGIGVGNLIGGVVVGLIGARFARGKLVIFGYAAAGACVAVLGTTQQLPLAIGLMIGIGIANMAYVIPSQTMFQQRTPPELMGRVVGFRFALVFGAMTLAMGIGGVLGQVFGVGPVIAISGLVTLTAGLAGILVPAVRDA